MSYERHLMNELGLKLLSLLYIIYIKCINDFLMKNILGYLKKNLKILSDISDYIVGIESF